MDNKRVDGTVGWSLRRFGKPVRRLLVALALRARLRRTGSLRLLARGVHADLGAATGCGASPGSADGSHLPAASASAEELIAPPSDSSPDTPKHLKNGSGRGLGRSGFE